MQDYNQAYAYISALTQQHPETAIVDFRLIHDTDKSVPAIKRRGTLPVVWPEIIDWQSRGYGCFVNVSEMDGIGNDLSNVAAIRAHLSDLDNIDAMAQLEMASKWSPAPTFGVYTSPGKAHVYWVVQPYQSNEYFTTLQRKIKQQFNGDPSVIDASRVARMPGTLHLKNPQQPYLVNCFSLGGYGQSLNVETLAASLQHVNVIEGHHGRKELGDPSLAAPSLEWLSFAMSYVDPNTLDRGDWLSITAAFKQAGWNHADEETLFNMWSEWCAQYNGNDPAENLKNWNSIRNSEIGWKSFRRRVPVLKAYEDFGYKTPPVPQPVPSGQPAPQQQQPDASVPMPQTEEFGDILSEQECKSYFNNCFFVERQGEILTPRGRFMNSTKFNGAYGGKLFVITPDGKTTDEPWKAATRSTMWTVPKVDHIRFLPDQPTFAIIEDQLGRKGVNTYIPIRIRSRAGDVTPFLRHMELMLPVESDRHILYRYFAHNVKFPGYKIPWAPMIQSTEGVGKGFIQEVMETILGEMYTYSPKAEELVKSGSTFNAWQRGKLMIIVNEIKVDERRELIEILKPMISDRRVEIQSKGVDQEMEDNPANWLFFSNFKNAIPVAQNGRRYSIFYSAIQSKSDLAGRGMNDAYFNGLFTWLRNGGSEAIAHWLLNYPVTMGDIPMRAPETSSHAEAVKVSRGPLEVCILNAIEDALSGFRGGYISTLAVASRSKQIGLRTPSHAVVCSVLETMGYYELGRAPRQFSQESIVERTTVYGCIPGLPVDAYGRAQGYE